MLADELHGVKRSELRRVIHVCRLATALVRSKEGGNQECGHRRVGETHRNHAGSRRDFCLTWGYIFPSHFFLGGSIVMRLSTLLLLLAATNVIANPNHPGEWPAKK